MNNSEIKILLVDDDEMIRECIGAYLEDEGFAVYFAGSGEEALENIASICPVVCISDMRLAGMNGETFICKAHQLSAGTGFMVHTGSTYILSERLQAIGMTAADVFIKPIHELSRLTERINQLAAAREQTRC